MAADPKSNLPELVVETAGKAQDEKARAGEASPATIVKEKQTVDLWTQLQGTLATELAAGDGDALTSQGTTLLFLGMKNSGKTTLLNRYCDKRDRPRPTLALEYQCKHKAGNDFSKQVAHIWELGGGTFLKDLSHVPLTKATIRSAVAFIVLDLAKPGDCASALQLWMHALNERVEQCLQELQSEKTTAPIARAMKEKSWRAYGDEHPDKHVLNPCAVPVVVIANKYDLHKNAEVEALRILSHALRYICHIHGATLIYTSEKESSTMKKFVGWVNHFAFATRAGTQQNTDHTKAILVPPGADTIASIGPPPAHPSGIKGKDLQMWLAAAEQAFPPTKETEDADDEGEATLYMEALIDSLRTEKNVEFEAYRAKNAASLKE